MDKRNINIKLMEDGRIRLNNNNYVNPKNKVYTLDVDDNLVEFLVSGMYIVKMDVDDYFKLSIWNNRLEFGHADISKGVVAMDDGFKHRSVPALIMNADENQRVGYRAKCNRARFDLRKSNLYIKGKANAVVAEG